MELDTAFDQHQTAVNADPAAVTEARRRRDLFKQALTPEDDITETFPSGSLARGSQIEPIHDVDFVAVYDPEAHPDWGNPGSSAEDALRHVGSQANRLLGATNGTVAQEVRLASPRNHAVKCFLDDPDAPDAFTVDVMPALRQADGTLRIPERRNRQWVPADPQDLIRRVADRHAAWNQFVRLVRVLKHWNDNEKAGMKSLVVEVLALYHLPVAPRPEALQRFFTAAAVAVGLPVTDPAGLCGEIQPDLDREHARTSLQAAADVAWEARAAQARGDTDEAICLWRRVLGPLRWRRATRFSLSPCSRSSRRCGRCSAACPAALTPRSGRRRPSGAHPKHRASSTHGTPRSRWGAVLKELVRRLVPIYTRALKAPTGLFLCRPLAHGGWRLCSCLVWA